MEEIEKRLRESTDACIKNFENWVKESKSLESREILMETMHEVRKVIARVEIEIAISERDRLGSRPIPIPPHRSQRKRPGEASDDSFGNEAGDDDAFDAQQPSSNHDQPRRQQHQGGGGGRHRRPMPNRENRGGGGGGNTGGDNQQQ